MSLPAGWHDVECLSYAADLPLWRELAGARGGPVLDLGCGTGRVALDLAARGHEVVALDSEPALVAELSARARERSLPVEALVADARSFDLGRRFPLAFAAMQVVQLLGGVEGRAGLLRAAAAHLQAGGLLSLALADPFEEVPPGDALLPLPDVREQDGWVLSSQPVAVRSEPGAVAIDRVRQAVSPSGELSEELATIRLDSVAAEELEVEARAAGYGVIEPRRVGPTADHVGSTVVMLEAP